MRRLCCLGLVTLVLASAASPALAGPALDPPLVCGAFQDVDVANLSAESFTPDETWRQPWDRWALGGAAKPWRGETPAVWFRLTSTDGHTSRLYEREVFGRRDGKSWSLFARQRLITRRPLAWSGWRRITVSDASAARLTSLVESPCLWATPQYLYGEIPLRDGRSAISPDGPLTFFDIRATDRQWQGVQVSWIMGDPGEFRAIVLAEAFGLPEYRDGPILGYALDAPTP